MSPPLPPHPLPPPPFLSAVAAASASAAAAAVPLTTHRAAARQPSTGAHARAVPRGDACLPAPALLPACMPCHRAPRGAPDVRRGPATTTSACHPLPRLGLLCANRPSSHGRRREGGPRGCRADYGRVAPAHARPPLKRAATGRVRISRGPKPYLPGSAFLPACLALPVRASDRRRPPVPSPLHSLEKHS